MPSDPIAVTLIVTTALDDLGVPYAIGGSLASALHGVVRATMDADIIAAILPPHVTPFLSTLGDAFYADEDVIRQAVDRRQSFNLIHLESMFKIDVFVAGPRPLDRAQLARRQRYILIESTEQAAYVTSAEDTILAKLSWYRLGGETSERQWRDISGILQVQQQQLDMAYLHRLAAEIEVGDLLARAVEQAQDATQG
jgi:hypothetical protein